MKSKEEIDELSEEFLTFHQEGSKVYHIKIREAIEFAYNKCQQDMASKKLDVDDIDEMALDYIINSGGLPNSVKEFQHCLHKFYEQINKQDNEK